MRRRRAVLEDMAEMAAAAAAMHFGAGHAVSPIGCGLDRSRLRIVETRPAGAALELLLRSKQRLFAAGTIERAGTLLVIECATARPLGAVLAHDVELLGSEDFLPFRIGMRDRVVLGIQGGAHGRTARLAMMGRL